MDYNKEEAERARDTAMKKFLANDFVGAWKFAMKAQSMNPEIHGITQMVDTFGMHLAAQHTINGEVDYYGVLGVKPDADKETMKKRYKKLAVMLHPDRNKSIGAEDAFTYVSQAWGVLSDKAQRAAYDSKRNYGASSPNQAYNGTFWTVCNNCMTQFEYYRVYLNQNLLCPHCRKPFIAVETDPAHSGSILKTFIQHQSDSIRHLIDGRKKSRENNRAAATPTTNPTKRRKVVENAVAGANLVASSSAPLKSNNVREFSEEELKNVLMMKKSKPIIVTKLEDLFTIDPENDTNVRPMKTEDASACSSQNKSPTESCCVDSVEDTTCATDKDLDSLTVNVHDSDFGDFDKNRSEKSFSDNQIWASYDSLGGMPRVYFKIDEVLSVAPFKVRITKLTSSAATSELTSSNWLGLGVERTCGGFIAGESQNCKTPDIFSHKVEVMKGNQGEFLIYPRTGDVWALYKNWSHDWNYLAGGKEVEYDVVEVVEGYTEEFGVRVVPLMKVAGFKSVFRHYLDPEEIKSISKDELSRFSHQIPSYLLTGRKAVGELGGCRHLDPAATPSQLLQVIDG